MKQYLIRSILTLSLVLAAPLAGAVVLELKATGLSVNPNFMPTDFTITFDDTGDDRAVLFGQKLGRMIANVPKALNNNRGSLKRAGQLGFCAINF